MTGDVECSALSEATSGTRSFGIPDRLQDTGRGVCVGIIDSGWDRTVNDPRVSAGIGLVDRSDGMSLVWSADDHDHTGHGTATADIVLQVATNVTIVPIRVFGQGLETSPDIVIKAIDWAAQQGIRIVNLSLTTTRPDALAPLYRACERARRAGTLLVAAAASQENIFGFPAVFDGVIGVGHANVSDPLGFVYRPGEAVEFGARAFGLRARSAGGLIRHVRGTSFAAPIITGYIARILERYPAVEVDEVRFRLGVQAAER